MEIKKRNRAELKSYFVKNAIPTENNFADLIDATLIQASDGVAKPAGDPLSVEAVGDNTSRRQLLNFYDSFSDSGPQYSIELNPRSDPDKPATGKPGLSLSDGAGYSRIFIQSQTGYVGIGTNAPTHTFHVTSAGAVGLFESTQSAAYLRLSTNEGMDNRIEVANRSGGRLALSVAGAPDAFNILRDGKVGIGTTAPTHAFHVKSGPAVGLFESTQSGAYLRLTTNEGMDNRVEFANRTGGRLALWVGGGYDALNILRDGKVGIGTTAPTHTFHVRSKAAVGLFESTENVAYLQISTNEGANNRVEIANRAGGRLALSVAGSDALSILRDGKVGIGTTAPTRALHVKSSKTVALFESTQNEAFLRITTNEGLDNRVEVANRSGGRLALFVAGGQDALNVLRNGRVGIGTTDPKRQLHVGGDGQISLGEGPGIESSAGLFWGTSSAYSIHRSAGPWTNPTYQQLVLDWRTGIVLKPGNGNNTGHDKSYVHIYGGKGLRVSEGPVVVGGIDPGDATLRVENDNGDRMDVQFASGGAGNLQFTGWSGGWNIDTFKAGSHLHLNRDADSNVYIGRTATAMNVLSSGQVSIKGAPLGSATFSVNGDIRTPGVVRADGGIIIGKGDLSEHIEADGSLYRKDGQMYIVVDDNLFIRDQSGGVKFHFDTNSGILRQEAWIGATLQSSWQNYGGGYNSAAYYKSKDGRVYLRGLVKDGAVGGNATIFTLPAGYRPPSRELCIVKINTSFGRIDIDANGRVIPWNISQNDWVSLDGISFRP